MARRKDNPVPKGHARWPLERSSAQREVLAALVPGRVYALADVYALVQGSAIMQRSEGAVRSALHRLARRGLVKHTRSYWKRIGGEP